MGLEESTRKRIGIYTLHVTSPAIAGGSNDFQIGVAELQNSLKNDIEVRFVRAEAMSIIGPAPVAQPDWDFRFTVLDGETDRAICRHVHWGQLRNLQTREWDWTEEIPEGRRGWVLHKHQGALKVSVDNLQAAGNIFVHFTVHCYILEE